jgi:hypothetical protein
MNQLGRISLFILPMFLLLSPPQNVIADGDKRGPDVISTVNFETIPSDTGIVGNTITLQGEVVTSGSIVSGGDIESTGMICSTAGCIGDPVTTAVREALITFDVPSGAPGGYAAAPGEWATRELNTVVYDTAGIIFILSGSQILLEPGTYAISANQVFMSELDRIQQVRARFRNVTEDTTVALSMNGRLHAPTGTSGHPQAEIPPTIFTVKSLSGFELQYFISNAHPGENALGHGSFTGEVERYAYVHLRKL